MRLRLRPRPRPRRASSRGWRALLLHAALALACANADSLANAQALAQADAPLNERDLRTAYLFNFIRFTEWPKEAFATGDAPIVLCVDAGGPGASLALAPLDGKTVGGRKIHVVSSVPLAAVRDCHVVYVADAALVHLPSLRDKLGDAPALLVGESDAALDRGAMIGFRAQERRLGFIVNLAAARRAGLRLPPQLLRIAAEVRE